MVAKYGGRTAPVELSFHYGVQIELLQETVSNVVVDEYLRSTADDKHLQKGEEETEGEAEVEEGIDEQEVGERWRE